VEGIRSAEEYFAMLGDAMNLYPEHENQNRGYILIGNGAAGQDERKRVTS